MFVDDMALLAKAGHRGAHGVRLPAGHLDHLFKTCAGSGLKEGEQFRRLGLAWQASSYNVRTCRFGFCHFTVLGF